MFSPFKIFVIYLIIPSRLANILPASGEKPTLSFEERVKKELDPLQDSLKKIIDPLTSNDEKLEMKGVIQGEVKKIIERAIERDQLIEERGSLKKQIDFLIESTLLNIWRLLIDDYEESFPQPYENDFEQKKVIYDKSKFVNRGQYDLIEERRRQKWLFYCEKPPNKRMLDLVDCLERKNIDFDTFSSGIAKAYHLLSDKFHLGFYNVVVGNPKKYFMFKNVVTAMRILLEQEDILDELVQKVAPNSSGK